MALHEQHAVYKAQESLVGHGRVFRDIPEAQDYVDCVTKTLFWQLNWPHADAVRVVRWTSRQWAACASRKEQAILLTKEGLTERTVLHELAHIACEDDEDAHGECFVRIFLSLVREFMGFYSWVDFRTALRDSGEFQFV